MPGSNARRQIILHAGLPKTGTTYLQRCFVANRSWLADRGVGYPQYGQEHQNGHHNLSFRLRDLPPQDTPPDGLNPEQAVRRALDEGDHSRVLLSSEGFSALDPAGVSVLQRAFDGCDVRVAVYLRRRSQVCVSAWQESVKHGSPVALLEFVAEQLLGSSARILRFEQVLTAIYHAFGRAAMRVIVYDHVVEDGLDLFEHFVTTALDLEVDEGLRGRGRTINEAIAPARLEVVRAINQARAVRGKPATASHLAPLLEFLARDPLGRELTDRVADVIERRGEHLDLSALDSEWRDRDQSVRLALGDAVCNAAGEHDLFRPGDSARPRILRPSELYAAIPPAEFGALLDRLDGSD